MSIPLRGWRVADQKSKSFVGSKRTAGCANWITGGLNSSSNRNGRTGAAIQPKISIRSCLKIHLFGERASCIRCPNEYTKKTLHKSFHRCPCKHEDDELERECTSTAKNNLKDEQIALRWMNGVATESEATHRFPDIPGYQKCETDIQESLRSVGDSEGEIRTDSEKKFVNGTTLGKEGGVLGAIALVIGTSVGAGILALPAKTADAGFFPSAVILGVSWSFLVAEALIIAEVNVHVRNTFCKKRSFCTASEVISLRTMANYTLGPVGGFLAALIYLLLSYTLLIAYIAKAGEVVPILVHLPASIAGILFTFGFGGFIYLGGREYAQHMNTVLTAALIGLFLFIVAEGAVVGDWENLHHMDWQRVPGSIPVVLLALVYHDIIPGLLQCSVDHWMET